VGAGFDFEVVNRVVLREHRPNDAPLVVTEFVAHDSKLCRWSLNHGNAVSNICLNVRFQGLSRHRMVPRGESVNDPKRTLGLCAPSSRFSTPGERLDV
jgi:hypothetical protein